MVNAAQRLAIELAELGLPVHRQSDGATMSHAFALDAGQRGGGHTAAKALRAANLLTSAIGLPHDVAAGVRIGTNETVRWGMLADRMPELAGLIARAWNADDPGLVAADVTEFRGQFQQLHFVR